MPFPALIAAMDAAQHEVRRNHIFHQDHSGERVVTALERAAGLAAWRCS